MSREDTSSLEDANSLEDIDKGLMDYFGEIYKKVREFKDRGVRDLNSEAQHKEQSALKGLEAIQAILEAPNLVEETDSDKESYPLTTEQFISELNNLLDSLNTVIGKEQFNKIAQEKIKKLVHTLQLRVDAYT